MSWERLIGAGVMKGKEALENREKPCSEYSCNEPRLFYSDYCRRHDGENQEKALNRRPLFPGLSGTFEVFFYLAFWGVVIYVVVKVGSCVF